MPLTTDTGIAATDLPLWRKLLVPLGGLTGKTSAERAMTEAALQRANDASMTDALRQRGLDRNTQTLDYNKQYTDQQIAQVRAAAQKMFPLADAQELDALAHALIVSPSIVSREGVERTVAERPGLVDEALAAQRARTQGARASDIKATNETLSGMATMNYAGQAARARQEADTVASNVTALTGRNMMERAPTEQKLKLNELERNLNYVQPLEFQVQNLLQKTDAQDIIDMIADPRFKQLRLDKAAGIAPGGVQIGTGLYHPARNTVTEGSTIKTMPSKFGDPPSVYFSPPGTTQLGTNTVPTLGGGGAAGLQPITPQARASTNKVPNLSAEQTKALIDALRLGGVQRNPFNP